MYVLKLKKRGSKKYFLQVFFKKNLVKVLGSFFLFFFFQEKKWFIYRFFSIKFKGVAFCATKGLSFFDMFMKKSGLVFCPIRVFFHKNYSDRGVFFVRAKKQNLLQNKK